MKKLILATLAVAVLALAAPADADDPKPASKVEAKADVKVDGKLTKVAPASQPAVPTIADDDVEGALERGKEAVAAARAGNWWYFSALVVALLMFLLKFIGIRQGFWPKLGRWRYFIAPALSVAAALLAAFQGGVSLETAIGVMTSSYVTSSLQEAWEHGVLNKPRAAGG